MGVEHALACSKCRQWIDLHKCYATYTICTQDHAPYSGEPDTYEGVEKHWGGRALWFVWKHRDHGSELQWHFDEADDYWEMTHEFFEVESNTRETK